jgi:CubicO group peptidase (beta-lactamase class C family)
MATPLPRTAPETVGIPSGAVLDFLDGAAERELELHGLMVLRQGQVAAEGWWAPYRAEDVHLLYSLSKSFTSTAVGFAIAEGRFGLDDSVLDFFPEDAPARPSLNLRAMRVRHLLTMSVGQEADDRSDMAAEPDGNWPRAFLARPVVHQPGSRFLYNSSATYMLSAIVQRTTGETLLDYLRPRLFEPLGIEGAVWETDPHGVNVGGWGLSVRTEDIARFGLLYLHRGVWGDRRLLSEAWVDEATRSHIATDPNATADWRQGYGFQFWRCQHGAYRGDGAFGQFCVVHPALDLVVAITSRVDDMQAVLDLVWKHLAGRVRHGSLPPDPAGQAALQTRLAGLALKGLSGATTSPTAPVVSGCRYERTDDASPYHALRVAFREAGAQLTVSTGGGDATIPVGMGAWAIGTMGLDGKPARVAAWGAWQGDELRIRLQYLESPASTDLVFRFAGDEVEVRTLRRGDLYLPAEGALFRGRRGAGQSLA